MIVSKINDVSNPNFLDSYPLHMHVMHSAMLLWQFRPSVTIWCCSENNAPIAKLFPPSGSGMILVSLALTLLQNSKRIGKICDFRSKMVRDRPMVVQITNTPRKSMVVDRFVSVSFTDLENGTRGEGSIFSCESP